MFESCLGLVNLGSALILCLPLICVVHGTGSGQEMPGLVPDLTLEDFCTHRSHLHYPVGFKADNLRFRLSGNCLLTAACQKLLLYALRAHEWYMEDMSQSLLNSVACIVREILPNLTYLLVFMLEVSS